MSNISKGVVLGLANTLVLASGYAELARTTFYDRTAPTAALLFVLGSVPAVPLGAILGAIAGRLRHERVPTLMVASFAVVGSLVIVCSPLLQAYESWQLGALIALAWLPTSFATLVLERWTRPPELAPAIVITSSGSGLSG